MNKQFHSVENKQRKDHTSKDEGLALTDLGFIL